MEKMKSEMDNIVYPTAGRTDIQRNLDGAPLPKYTIYKHINI